MNRNTGILVAYCNDFVKEVLPTLNVNLISNLEYSQKMPQPSICVSLGRGMESNQQPFIPKYEICPIICVCDHVGVKC
jgi:hypothetical protein